jgi:16S rRNA (cytidine1402-2'-O)-methyltransferase
MGILYVVATPIGNLQDITLRALEVLKRATLVLAEDTRVTQKLFARYKISVSLKRYNEYFPNSIYKEVKTRLKRNECIALVSDAGTPAINDPGSELIDFLREDEELAGLKIVPIPGPSALITVLSVSGWRADKFTFLGYPPHKKGRAAFFKSLQEIKIRPIVFYESPYRLQKTFLSLSEVFGPDCKVVVGRELTKIHEEIFRGQLKEAAAHFVGERGRGEFVLVLP